MQAIQIERRGTEKRIQTLPGYYAAKFAREAKENPSHWIIRPVSRGYELVRIR
jgi:hypothetical protein